MFSAQYNDYDAKDIERHAKQLEQHCLGDYVHAQNTLQTSSYSSAHKGQLGNLIEELFFNYKPNSNHDADFPHAGVELKITPLKLKGALQTKQLTTKERLVLSMINFHDVVHEEWENNTLMAKLRHILFMFYLHEQKAPLELVFKLVSLWSPSEADLAQIKQDWQLIVDKIKSGHAHTLSEADTNYLGACPKGKNKEDTTTQPFSSEKAMRRAFSLKTSYIRTIYHELSAGKSEYVSIAPQGDFEGKIQAAFAPFVGKSLQEFITENALNTARSSKHFNKVLVDEFLNKLFGAPSEKIEEFQKANITLKTIFLKENGIPKESMSFKQIQYKEILSEQWEDFEINKIHAEGRFLWVVFRALKKYEKQSELSLSDITLEKVMFWNMPYEDLQIHYRALWEDTKAKVAQGDYNNFLKASEHPIGHIRPKARNADDKMETPQGGMEGKKCFWLNAGYVAEQIKANNIQTMK